MRKVVAASLLFPALLLAVSCSSRGGGSMTFGDVTIVDDFPEVMELDAGSAEIVNLDVPGIIDIISRDSILMAVSTREAPIVSLFEYSTLRPRGEFMRHGNGPKELLPFYMPTGYESRFFHQNDSLFVDIVNGNKNTLRWNVSSAYCDSLERVSEMPPISAAASLFGWRLNDSTVLSRRLENSSTQLVRCLYVNGKLQTPSFLEELNKAEIDTPNNGYMINILSSLVGYNPKSDIVADIAIVLDVINLYSLSSDFRRTIQLAKKPMSIEKAETTVKLTSKLPRSIWYAAPYDDFFAVLYGREEQREILLFSWNGVPLCKYILHEPVSAFDINGNCLLVLDSDSETIHKYQIKNPGR